MKKHFSTLLLCAALTALGYAMIAHPPSGVPWQMFIEEQTPLAAKLRYLAGAYVWPFIVSFVSIVLFQLQFRLSGSGANKRTVFAVCAIASAAMLEGVRTISYVSTAGPSYVAGMALGYTVMSRLYAIRMRTLYCEVRIPWPIWRGNAEQVAQLQRRMQQA
jgi:hypothetical protein